MVVVYVRPGEVPPALWREGTDVCGGAGAAGAVCGAACRARRASKGERGVSATGAAHGVPGMPVDADDAVAIYRVAQESIGRARIGGGAALMECVPFVLEGAKASAARRRMRLRGWSSTCCSAGVATRRGWGARPGRSPSGLHGRKLHPSREAAV